MKDRVIVITYTNHRGVTESRRITPLTLWFGTTEHHTTEQWLVYAYCHEREAHRNFAMKDISSWSVQP